MLDWDDLRFLLAVAEHRSASAASRALGVDKATVARRIGGLERGLGVRLLLRRASGWKPTAAGERVAVIAREVERKMLGLRSEYAGEAGAPRTQVSVTAPQWFTLELLVPALQRLLAEAPWMDVSLASTSRVLDLPQREADVALRNKRPEHGDFVVRRAGELGSAIYASRTYLKVHGKPAGRADFAHHRVVRYQDRVTYVPGFSWFEDLCKASSAGAVSTDDAQAIARTIGAGAGLGVIPCFLGDRAPTLVRVGDEVHRENIWIVSPVEAAETRGVKLLSALVVSTFKANARALGG